VLILGWNGNIFSVLQEYDAFLHPGSEIIVAGLHPPEKAHALLEEKLPARLANATVSYVQADYTSSACLGKLLGGDRRFDTCILLADQSSGERDPDARTIVTILLLQDYQARNPDRRLKQIVAEVLSVANSELLQRHGEVDTIISPRLISMLLAQVSHAAGNLALRVVVEFVENHGQGDAREDFRAEFALRILPHEPLHGFILRLPERHNALRSDVAREDDIPRRKIQHAIAPRRQSRRIEQLQQHIEHARMRFFDFIEEQRPAPGARVETFRNAPRFLSRAEEQRQPVRRLILRHVESDDSIRPDQILREAQRQFRFADTGRPEKHEARLRPTRRREAEFAMLEPLRHEINRDVLPREHGLQPCRETPQFFALCL
jgi:hypothetical protein